jgi:hypothetical protein
MKRVPRTAFAAAIAASFLAAACNGPTPVVSNGSVSACYRAIPVGRTAIHDPKARLIGVHRIPADQVRSRLPPAARAELAAENDTAVCAMAFKGTFNAGQVNLAAPEQHGDYALILVSSRKLDLIGAVVLDHLPKAFGGRTI